MFFIAIIIGVVLLIMIHNQGSRIDTLERLVKANLVQGNNTTSKIATAQASVSTPVLNPLPSGTNLEQTPIKQAVPLSTPTPASHEEVSGRILGRIGIGAVLVGVSFFLKYAFDNNWIGEAGRVMIGIMIGVAFLAVGQWLRKNYLTYSDLLMGGGLGILYLSIFGAHSYYNLIGAGTTGILMFVVTLTGFAISIANATINLAAIATIGGFATPFLMGTHENNMLGLFGYITMLNLGVLAISFFKKWPRLTFFAFLGTGINFIGWFSMFYTQTELVPTFAFLFITFIIFIFASIARGITVKTHADALDYLILGANAFAFAFFSYTILNPLYHYILGFGAVVIALIYIGVATITNKRNPEDTALNIFLPGLAVTFLTLAVPVQLSGPWVPTAWLIESLFLYIIASFISNRGFQVMGIIIYFLGLISAFKWSLDGQGTDFIPVFNTGFAILTVATIIAYAIAYTYKKYGSISVEIQKRGITAFVIIANIITVQAISTQIIFHYDSVKAELSQKFSEDSRNANLYNTGYDNSGERQEASTTYYAKTKSLTNESNTAVSIFLTFYAALLTAIGFARRIVGVRRLGLLLFVITGLKVFVDVWSLGPLYRIISFIVFGIIALLASFAYTKYKDRL